MTKSKILIVDDEEHICDLVKTYFSDDYEVVAVYNGNAAVDEFKTNRYEMIILDLMLPGVSGWEVCRAIRQSSRVPIIMLTAKDDDIDKILGLELGADDYVTKPFNPRELLARAKAVLRRSTNSAEEQNQVLDFPGLNINMETRQVRVKDQEIELTPKEFDLLWLFAGNPGMVFNREHLIKKVWGFDYMGDTRTIDNTVKRLRRKLESVPGAPFFIQTVWGVGYKFEVPEA